MNYYVEITLLSNPDVGLFKLWSQVFGQLHLSFVENQNGEKKVAIGLSFPEYKMGNKFGILGGKCRLFSSEKTQLEKLDLQKWLSRLSDYVHITSIRDVPKDVSRYTCFSRVQVKSNIERLARRKAQHEKISLEEAMKKLEKVERRVSELPFIHLRSLSGGQDFRLFIKKTESDKSIEGSFSLYGLSPTVTVPDF